MRFFVGLSHVQRCCIGQLFTNICLLSGILGVVLKRLLVSSKGFNEPGQPHMTLRINT